MKDIIEWGTAGDDGSTIEEESTTGTTKGIDEWN